MVAVPPDDQNPGVQTISNKDEMELGPNKGLGQPSAEDKPVVNDDTVALTQKKVYKEKSVYSNQQLESSLQSFNNAINSVFSIINLAKSLKTKTSDQPVNKNTNYYLTDAQKVLLQQKATDFAKPGIVPFDVIEEFLYVLCYIDDYETLKMVATATEISKLANINFIREPDLLLNVKDLYKVGYMANGLAALTKKIDSRNFPQGESASDNNKSAYSSLFTAASGLTELAQTIQQFPGVGAFGTILSQIVSINGAVQGLTSAFSSSGTTQTKVQALTNVTTQLASMKESMSKSIDTIKQHNVTSLFPLADKMKAVTKNVKPVLDAGHMMKQVQTSNSFPNDKVDDLNIQLKSIFDGVTKLTTGFTELQSLLGNIQSPGNIGSKASTLLSLPSGMSTSQKVTEQALGQAVPPNILAKNPMMMASSYVGRAFFGEGLIPVAVTDQMFSRKIGNFPTASSGAGVSSFQMQNFASMGSAMSMQQMLMQIVYGIMSVEEGTPLAQMIQQQTSNIAGVLGASLTSKVEPRRSDNAIPMMIAMATVLSNDSGCPFPSKVFSDGWKLASSVGNDLQNSAPDYLKRVQTYA